MPQDRLSGAACGASARMRRACRCVCEGMLQFWISGERVGEGIPRIGCYYTTADCDRAWICTLLIQSGALAPSSGLLRPFRVWRA